MTASYRRIVLETGWELLFPQRCPVCGGAISLEDRTEYIKLICGAKGAGDTELRKLYDAVVCPECRQVPEYIKEPLCSKCGKQLNDDEDGLSLCSDCIRKPRQFVQNRAVFIYDEPVSDILSALKYHSKSEYADFLGLAAADVLAGWLRRIKPDVMVPVPIHADRMKKRGYNQAELIADKLSLFTGIPAAKNILIRKKTLPRKKT